VIVVLTATEAAYGAVRALLPELKLHEGPAGTLFEVSGSVALGLTGTGNHAVAAVTERAITEFAPAAVFLVGEAGPLRSWLEPGDVVVATRIYAYEGGREDASGFQARPRAWEAPHRLEQLARHVARSFTAARVEFQPIAAGEVLLGPGAALEDRLHTVYNDAVAVDMESAGLAGAGHLHDATPTLVVRGIGTAAPAAAFALAVIAALPSSGARSGQVIKNVLRGDVHGVAVQVGVVHGDVTVHRAEDDFVAAVTAAARSGVVDEVTFARVMLALRDPRPRQVLGELLADHPDLLGLL
jgi:nucleoside phosphorylase